MGPTKMNCCRPKQVGTKEHGKMLKRIQVLEDGRVPAKEAMRQCLKFDGEASGMTPDTKRSKETVKQGDIRESNALPGESPEEKKVRFLSDSGGGGACAITVEEFVEDYWSDEHGQGEMFEGNQIWM